MTFTTRNIRSYEDINALLLIVFYLSSEKPVFMSFHIKVEVTTYTFFLPTWTKIIFLYNLYLYIQLQHMDIFSLLSFSLSFSFSGWSVYGQFVFICKIKLNLPDLKWIIQLSDIRHNPIETWLLIVYHLCGFSLQCVGKM